MIRRCRRALRAMALSIALVAVAGGTAAAAGGTLEPAGEAAFVSNGPITFEAGGFPVACDVTYAGTLAMGPTGLSGGAPLGAIDDVQVGECSGGTITAVLELPWQLTVDGTAGTLPSAATDLLLTLEDPQIEFSVLGGLAICLYGGDVQLTAALSGSNPYAVGAVVLEGTVARAGGGLFCPATGTVAGTLDLLPAQTLAVGGFTAFPKSVDFAEVTANTTARKSVSLMNATDNQVRIARVRVNGSTAFVPRPREGFAVAAESMSNISVEYTPTAAGEHTAVLEFEDEEGNVVLRVSVRGRGR